MGNWRCILRRDEAQCKPTTAHPGLTTTTEGIPETSTTRVRTTTSPKMIQTTTTKILTTTGPANKCPKACMYDMTCEEMRTFNPFSSMNPGQLDQDFNPFVCSGCTCPTGSSKEFYADVCVRLPEQCNGCMLNGTEYPVGSKVQEGTCDECKCETMPTGEPEMRCYATCNIREYDCRYKGMKFVNDGETCCHCEPLPTTTTKATTTTPTTTGTPCPADCVAPITCRDEAIFRQGDISIPFEFHPDCMMFDCACPGNSTIDHIWETGMCLALDEVCEEPCVLNGERYGPGESFERGCNVCTCEYDMFFFEKCLPFCNLTSDDCATNGELLQNNPGECCSCVSPPTTTPVPTTTAEPTTKHEKMQPTTQPQTPDKTTTGLMTTLMSTMSSFFTTTSSDAVEETTPATVPTTVFVTTPMPTCLDECSCTLGCNGEQDKCIPYQMCSHACICADEDAFKVNSRCALWPSPEECPSTSTTAFKTTVEPRIEETTTAPVDGTTSARTTTSAPVDGTTPEGTTTSAPVDGTTPARTTTTAPVDETTPEGTTTSAPVDGTTPEITPTTAPVDGTTPEGTTLPIASTTDASSTNAKLVTTSSLVPTTTSAAKTCSDDCRCDVTCEDQYASDDIPARCSQVDSTCDLCTCDVGEVKDPVTRKCVKYAECKKRWVYKDVTYEEGEIYWKGDCTQCTCTSENEKCSYDACRINQNSCEQKGQRFVQVPGTCCYCAPVVVNVTTTTVVVTTKPITEEVTTTPVEKTTAATKTTPEPATAPTTAQVDTTAEVVETTESYTEPIDYTTTAPTTAPEATTNMTTTRSTFTTTPKVADVFSRELTWTDHHQTTNGRTDAPSASASTARHLVRNTVQFNSADQARNSSLKLVMMNVVGANLKRPHQSASTRDKTTSQEAVGRMEAVLNALVITTPELYATTPATTALTSSHHVILRHKSCNTMSLSVVQFALTSHRNQMEAVSQSQLANSCSLMTVASLKVKSL